MNRQTCFHLLFVCLLLLTACKASQPSASVGGKPGKGSSVAASANYGVTEREPVVVGGGLQRGAANERAYIDRLRGPNGQPVEYYREGSCCQFKTPNGIDGYGLLDVYVVTGAGLKDTVRLYLNMYDAGDRLLAPKGFTLAEE